MIFEKLKWPILILHNWKGSIQKHHRKIKTLRRSVSQRCMHRETEKPPLKMIDEKLTDATSTSKKIKTDMKWWSLRIFSSSMHTLTEPRRRIEETCLFQDGHGVLMEKFLDRIFSTIFWVSFTCTSNYSVYGSVHTLTCCTHTFLHIARAQ